MAHRSDLGGALAYAPMSNALPTSDPIRKRLYAFPRMVADLLRSLFADEDLGADYGTLEKLPAEYVGNAFQQRRGDTAWRAARPQRGPRRRLAPRAGDAGIPVKQPIRCHGAAGAGVHRTAVRRTAAHRQPQARRTLPPVLPIVLYNGEAPWRPATEMRDLIAKPSAVLAPYQPSQRHVVLDERRVTAEELKLHGLTLAMTQLEQSGSVADLAHVARRLTALLSAGERELRRTFADWLRVLERRLGSGERTWQPTDDLSLEDMTVSLEERVAEWPKPYIRQGISLGREEGREEGISLGREEGISLGREQGISLGREQGISLGREQGIEHERQMLRRMASVRFGAAIGDRLAAAIGAEADPQRLMDVAEAIVRCTTASELLREVGTFG